MSQTIETYSGIALALVEIEGYVTRSAAFQKRVGAVSDAEAAPHVWFFESAEDPRLIQQARSFALVYPGREQWTRQDTDHYLPDGGIVLELQDRNRHPGTSYDARRKSALDFFTWCGEVLADVLAQVPGGSLRVARVVRTEKDGPFRCRTQDEGANDGGYWWVRYTFLWD